MSWEEYKKKMYKRREESQAAHKLIQQREEAQKVNNGKIELSDRQNLPSKFVGNSQPNQYSFVDRVMQKQQEILQQTSPLINKGDNPYDITIPEHHKFNEVIEAEKKQKRNETMLSKGGDLDNEKEIEKASQLTNKERLDIAKYRDEETHTKARLKEFNTKNAQLEQKVNETQGLEKLGKTVLYLGNELFQNAVASTNEIGAAMQHLAGGDENRKNMQFAQALSQETGNIGSNVQNKFIKALGMGFEGIGQQVPQYLFSAGGMLPTAGLVGGVSEFANTYNEMTLENPANKAKTIATALLKGTVAGALEETLGIFGKGSLDKMATSAVAKTQGKNALTTWLKRKAVSTGYNVGSEVVEENLENFAGYIIDKAINKKDITMQQMLEEFEETTKQTGMTTVLMSLFGLDGTMSEAQNLSNQYDYINSTKLSTKEKNNLKDWVTNENVSNDKLITQISKMTQENSLANKMIEENVKDKQNQGSTIENKPLLKQEQQTTLPEGKMPEKAISQENGDVVQKVSDNEPKKLEIDTNQESVYNNLESEGDLNEEKNESTTQTGNLGGDNAQSDLFEKRKQKQIAEQQYREWEKSIIPKSENELTDQERSLKNKFKKYQNKDLVFIKGDNGKGYNAGASLDNPNLVYINTEQSEKFGLDRTAYHETMESDIRFADESKKDIIISAINDVLDMDIFQQQKQEFWNNQEGEIPSDTAIAKDIICDRFAELNGEKIDYTIYDEIKNRIDLSIEYFKQQNSQNEGSILLPENNTLPQIDEDIEAFKEETANLDKEQKQRSFFDTTIESDYVSKEAQKETEKMLKTKTYTMISNNESIEKATKKINNSGLDAVYTSFVTKFDNNEKMTLDDITEAEILIQQYSYRGEIDKAKDLIEKVAIVGTELGQMVQALSIIKKSTPLSQLQVAEKIIERLNIEYDTDIQLSEDTLNKIKEANMDNIQDIMTEAYAEIGEQLPLTFTEKLHNFRYLAMLGNPKTHIKNKSGNIAMHILNNIKNEVSGAIQDIYSKFNDDYTQTNTIKRANSDQKTFAKEDSELMQDSIDAVGNKYSESPNSIITQNKRYFDNKILNALAKFNSERLDKADKKALRWAYKDAMQDYMAANNLTSDMLKEDSRELKKARDFAINQALEATFHQYNFLASKLNDIERNGGLVGGAVSAVLPFKKTPLNILKTGMEYSPAGLLNAGVNFVTKNQKAIERLNRELDTGKITEQEFNEKKSSIINKNIDEFSKGLTGSALALIGYAMANAKFLKAGNDDEEDELKDALGKQKYSITIGDYNISLDWLSPSAMPLFMGAEIYDSLQQDEELSKISALMGGVLSAFNPAFETTMLSNVSSALTSYSSDAEGKWENIIANIMTNYITSYISSFATNLYKTFNSDTTIRSTTSTKKNTTDKAIDTTWNNIKSRLPVAETYELLKAGADAVGLEMPEGEDTIFSQLPAKVDSYGQVQTREDNIWLRMVSNFINPATVNEISDVDAEITQEVERLNRGTETNVLPTSVDKTFTINSEDYRMSNDEYAKAKETYGKTYYETVNALIDSDTYNKLSDDKKAELISDIKSYSRESAKAEYAENAGLDYKSTNEMYNSFKAVEKAGGNAEDYIKYLVETNGMTDKAEKLNYLNSQGYTTKVKNAIYENDIGSNTYVSRSKDEKFNALNAIQGKVSEGYTLYAQKASEEAFKGDDGATGWEPGSKRNKLRAFLQDKSNGLTNIERYYIATFEGQAKYLLTSNQRNKLRQYLKDNKSKLDAETYNKMIDKLNEADK